MVLFSESSRTKHEMHIGGFKSAITFEQIVHEFPGLIKTVPVIVDNIASRVC